MRKEEVQEMNKEAKGEEDVEGEQGNKEVENRQLMRKRRSRMRTRCSCWTCGGL